MSIGLLLYGLWLVLRRLIDRFGPRRVATIGMAIIAGGMALSATARTSVQLHLFFGVLSGVGTGLIGSVLGATIANRWFVKRRGLVIGLFGVATSAGQLVFLPLLASLTVSQGWRTTSTWIALGGRSGCDSGCLVRAQRSGGTWASSLRWRQARPASVPGPASDGRAVRNPNFWLLVGTFGICGLTSNGIVGTHFIAHAVEHGFTETVAAGTLAVMGAFNFVGTIASGWLTDRVDPRRLLLVYYGFRGVSLFLIPALHDRLGLAAFAVLFGLDYIATVPPTVALAADTFGRQNVGTVYGWVFAAHQGGAAIAAWAGGYIREQVGDDGPAFLGAGVAAVLAGMAVLATAARFAPK